MFSYSVQSTVYCTALSIETAHPAVAVLGIDVEGLILDVMVSFFKFPVYILGFEYFTNTGFENQGVVNPGDLLRLNNIFKLNTSVCKVPDNREVIFFLHPLLNGTIINNGKSVGYCWLI